MATKFVVIQAERIAVRTSKARPFEINRGMHIHGILQSLNFSETSGLFKFGAWRWQSARSRRSILTDQCCNANSGPVQARRIASTPEALLGAARLKKIKAYRMLDNPPLDAALPFIVNFATPRKGDLRKLSASLARKRAVDCREADLPPAQDVGATLRPLYLAPSFVAAASFAGGAAAFFASSDAFCRSTTIFCVPTIALFSASICRLAASIFCW